MAQPRREPIPIVELELASVRTDHLRTLIDDVGIIQHAHGVIPNWETGYCVDDVARLAVVALELSGRTPSREWTPVLHRSLAFLQFAAGPEGTGMRNFMGYDRRWLDEPHLGDHVGRTVWALGEILSTAWIPAFSGPSRALLDALVPSLAGEVSLRTAAYSVLGLGRLDPDRLDSEARLLLERLVDQLATAYRRTASGGWLWFEDRLTYDNARLPQALIVGASSTQTTRRRLAGARGARMARRRVRPRRRCPPPAGASRDAIATSPRRATATSSHSTRRRSSRPSSPPSSSPARSTTAPVPAARSTGSSVAIASIARSTTSPPAAAATASARAS